MNINTIEGQWKNFEVAIIADAGSEEEIQAVRSVFYAGAISMMHLYDETTSMDSRNEALDRVKGWRSEKDQFLVHDKFLVLIE